MFKWLRKKKEPKTIIDYGRYMLKPVIGRALMHVAGTSQDSLAALIATNRVKLNGKFIQQCDLDTRLESGKYTIEICGSHNSQDRFWRFFIG